MQPATSTQPSTATNGVFIHEGSTTPLTRRRIPAAAIKPPANGSQALARNEKKADSIASWWLCHKHQIIERAAMACSARIVAPIFDLKLEARRQTSNTTNGIQM